MESSRKCSWIGGLHDHKVTVKECVPSWVSVWEMERGALEASYLNTVCMCDKMCNSLVSRDVNG